MLNLEYIIESFEKPQNTKLSKKDFDEISSEIKISDSFNFKEVEDFGNRGYSKSSIGLFNRW